MFKDKTILIVDDESDVIEIFKDVLENYFKKVIVSYEGDDSLDKFYRYRPDIVVTDYNMPYINGVEIISIIKSEFPNQKIVLLSGYNINEIKKDLDQFEADDYLSKPITIQELFTSLETLLL